MTANHSCDKIRSQTHKRSHRSLSSYRAAASFAATRMKKILITGCTRGLGRALVDRFTDMGHVVVGCGRTQADIDSLSRKYGAPHRFDRIDVSDRDAVQQWAAELAGDNFVPDLLINNGGVINQNAALWEVPADEFDNVINVNVKGVANVLRSFIPFMLPFANGVIVNISSGWGRSVSGEVAPYVCSKWAIEGLTKALAAEIPPGMAAIPLNPGVVNTALLQSCYGQVAATSPDANEWSHRAASMLLSLDESQNGQSLTV